MGGKVLIILSLLCLFCSVGYGSELLSEEAINTYNEGVKAQRAREFYRAKTSYQKVFIIDRNTKCKKFIFNNLGLIYAENGDAAKAEVAFKEALKLDPNYKIAASNLALLYLKLAISYKDRGDTRKALDNFEKAFSYYPERAFIIEEEKDAKAVSSGD